LTATLAMVLARHSGRTELAGVVDAAGTYNWADMRSSIPPSTVGDAIAPLTGVINITTATLPASGLRRRPESNHFVSRQRSRNLADGAIARRCRLGLWLVDGDHCVGTRV